MWIPPVFALTSIPLANELTTLEVLLLTTLFVTHERLAVLHEDARALGEAPVRRGHGRRVAGDGRIDQRQLSRAAVGRGPDPAAGSVAREAAAGRVVAHGGVDQRQLADIGNPATEASAEQAVARRRGTARPNRRSTPGVARLPVIRLLRIVTVAPTPVADPGM